MNLNGVAQNTEARVDIDSGAMTVGTTPARNITHINTVTMIINYAIKVTTEVKADEVTAMEAMGGMSMLYDETGPVRIGPSTRSRRAAVNSYIALWKIRPTDMRHHSGRT